MSLLSNTNDQFSFRHGTKNVYRSNHSTRVGRVIATRNMRDSNISMTYDVELFGSDITLQGCRVISSNSGINGDGDYTPLEYGTPVVLQFKDGNLQTPFIIGTFYTEGDHEEFYKKGNLKKPGDRIKDVHDFNQPSGHPNRITQDDAHFRIVAAKNIQSPYDSPEFSTEDVSNHSPTPGIIEIRNKNGASVNYSQTNITYTDGNNIIVSGGDREQKTSKLLNLSLFHSRRAEFFEKSFSTTSTQNSSQETFTSSGIKTLVVPLTSQGTTTDAISINYRAKQERKLAALYLEASKQQAQQSASRLKASSDMTKTYGNELSVTPTDPKQAFSRFKPNKEEAIASKSNYKARVLTKDYDLLVVLHETIVSASEAASIFQDPNSKASYHLLIKRDGTQVTVVPPSLEAYGAAPSQFNGEYEVTSNGNKSVNPFSYHISLESPLDGNTDAKSHSGYTEKQYESLAEAISSAGALPNRIVTHQDVDLSGSRSDPRSLDRRKLSSYLSKFPSKGTIDFGPRLKSFFSSKETQ